MRLETKEEGDLLIVHVRESRLDAAVVIRFKEEMRHLIDCAARRVMLDLEEVDFLDSSGLGAVVSVMKQLGPDRILELAGLSPTVRKVFRLTRMDTVFTIHDAAPIGVRRAV